jgi:nucleoside phosphorylase
MFFLCFDCLDAHCKREKEAGRALFPKVSDRIRERDPWFDPTPEQIAKAEEWRKKREEQMARRQNDSHRVSGEFLIDVFRNGTPKVVVRVTHVPTGLVVSGEGLTVYGVREQLLEELREKLAEKKTDGGV